MSKQMLRNATYSAHKLIKESRHLSFATRHDYKCILIKALKDLYSMGVQLPSIKNLKQKHVKRLLECWKEQQLSNGTLKNRLAAIRFALKQTGKFNTLPKKIKPYRLVNGE